MFVIKFSGAAEIPNELNREKNYIIAGEWEEISRTETDAKDGSLITAFKMKPVRLMTVDEGGKKVRLKTKSSNSKRVRQAIWSIHSSRDGFSQMDTEDYYDRFTNELLKNLPSVLDYLKL